MTHNQQNINKGLAEPVSNDLLQQYNKYKEQVKIQNNAFKAYKNNIPTIKTLIQDIKNEAAILEHKMTLSSLFNSDSLDEIVKLQDSRDELKIQTMQNSIATIQKYYSDIYNTSKTSLGLIFKIRYFLTGQKFDIYVETTEGKNVVVAKFSALNIEKHIEDGIHPSYTDNLDKYLEQLTTKTRAVAPELTKLTLSLKVLKNEQGKLKKGSRVITANQLKKAREQVANYLIMNPPKDEKGEFIQIPENRQLEMAMLIDPKHKNSKDNNELLQNYIESGSYKENVVMYKFGDIIKKINGQIVHVEVKASNGSISLTMVANAINRLDKAFSFKKASTQQKHLINFFSSEQASLPIEIEAQKDVEKKITEKFQKMGVIIQKT